MVKRPCRSDRVIPPPPPYPTLQLTRARVGKFPIAASRDLATRTASPYDPTAHHTVLSAIPSRPDDAPQCPHGSSSRIGYSEWLRRSRSFSHAPPVLLPLVSPSHTPLLFPSRRSK